MRRDKIFICYRRTTDNAARMLQTALKQKFGEKVVFIDVDHIEPGVDFVNRLQAQISKTAAMVVVVGPDWLTLRNANGDRRIDDPQDPVHVEVAAALFSGIDIFPTLVDGASMPGEDDLPLMLRPFARRNARKVPVDEFFPTAMEGLTKAIDASLKKARGPRGTGAAMFGGWAVGAAGIALAAWTMIADGGDGASRAVPETPGAVTQEDEAAKPAGQSDQAPLSGRRIERQITETEPNDEIFSATSIAPGELLEGQTRQDSDIVDYICLRDGAVAEPDVDLVYALNSPDGSFKVEAFRASGARSYSRFAGDHEIRAMPSNAPLCLAIHQPGFRERLNYRVSLTIADPE